MFPHKNDYHVVPAQMFCFWFSFILVLCIIFIHVNLAITEMAIKLKDVFFITGTTLLSIKLTRDGWEMPAAGFIILAIGWGVLFAVTDNFGQQIAKEMASSAFYFLIPAMVLITFYKPFKWWLKVLCLLCLIPFFMSLIDKISYSGKKEPNPIWSYIDILSIHLISLIWACFFFFNHRKQIKQKTD